MPNTIKNIFNVQKEDLLKMTPKLGEINLEPSHFQKMKVTTSSNLMSVNMRPL